VPITAINLAPISGASFSFHMIHLEESFGVDNLVIIIEKNSAVGEM